MTHYQTLTFEIEDQETVVEVGVTYEPGQPATYDDYGRQDGCAEPDDVEIIEIKLISGELAPTDEEIVDALDYNTMNEEIGDFAQFVEDYYLN